MDIRKWLDYERRRWDCKLAIHQEISRRAATRSSELLPLDKFLELQLTVAARQAHASNKLRSHKLKEN